MVIDAGRLMPAVRLCSIFLSIALPSCTGEIGDPAAPPKTTTGMPGGGVTGSGSNGTGSSSTPGGGSVSPPNGTGGGSGNGCSTTTSPNLVFRVLTRLNRYEYDSTARDLLGDTTHAALDALPADYGDGAFDNNAAALTIDPALAQQYVQLAETLAANAMAPNSAGRKLVLTCSTTDDACARQIAGGFAARAWRRPLQAGESDRLFALYGGARSAGFSFEQGVQTMIEAALLSPNFLFRPEFDPVIDSPTDHPLSSYELATRLSYFLWSTMPDSALAAAAAADQLGTVNALSQQVRRMWADPKAEAFYQRFPGLWLNTLDITTAKQPVPDLFPQFDATLEAAMEGETASFMREFVTADVDFMDFIDAKFTYVNQRLAQFYGLTGQFGSALTRVDLSPVSHRGGILTQASFLTLASAPERTSPVMRGQWVLSRILATPAPPPPDNVPPITAVMSSTPLTFRQKMEAHVSNPVCAGCHNLMDPIGFGLENYDAIGQWRTTDNGLPVDASGQLNTGETFTGGLELEAILKKDPRVPSAIVQYLASYALGREVGAADQCMIGSLANDWTNQDNHRMAALVTRVASLDAMRMRRGAP